jgi:hypothetical protein
VLHWVCGSLLLGAFEGGLLAWRYRVSARRAVTAMLLSNLLSVLVGLVLLNGLLRPLTRWLLGPLPLYGLRRALVALPLLGYGLGVLLEWPFVWGAFSRGQGSWRKAFRATVLVRTASWVGLVLLCLNAPDVGLIRNARVDPSLSFARGTSAWVYYLNDADQSLYRVRPDGTQRTRLEHAYGTDGVSHLVAEESGKPGCFDLWVHRWGWDSLGERLLTAVAGRPGKVWWQTKLSPNTPQAFGPPVDFRANPRKGWRVLADYQAGRGLIAWRDRPCRSLSFGLELPCLTWYSRCATVLPSGIVIYELGEQIVALDLRSRRMGVVALGRGPAVVLEQGTAPAARPR